MDDLQAEVRAAAGRAEVRAAVEAIYRDLQRDIDTRQPICDASGRCCRFEEFGHRLYVTTLELAAFVAAIRATTAVPAPTPQPEGRIALPQLASGQGDCPYQVDGLCSVHAERPFGCRVYFCDETSTQWQNERYERYHAELKLLHERLDVRYHYVEWRQALRSLGLMPERLSQSGREL